MRQFVLAICCAAAVGLLPTCGYGQSFGTLYAHRPEPPTEPSVPVAEKPAAAKAEPAAPKPAVRQKVVRRVAHGPVGPLTVPSTEALVMMVRGALAAVNQANFTGNYSVLHEMTVPALQTRVSASQFGKAFIGLRQQNLDLSPVLVLAPQFTTAPSLTPQGVLRLAGVFPSRPLQINFVIDYRAVDGFWLIEALSVSAVQANATAPQAVSATAPAPMQRQYVRVPLQRAFWEARFMKATQLGPYLRFAGNPH